jgi:hypothetical protein
MNSRYAKLHDPLDQGEERQPLIFLGSETLVFQCFRIQHIENPVEKETRHSAKEILKS